MPTKIMSKSTYVVDSSVMVKWLTQYKEPHLEQADLLMSLALDEKIRLMAPELAKYEVGNVLLCGKKLKPKQALFAIELLNILPITFIKEDLLTMNSSYSLAHELGVTYYDASFLSLTKQLGAVLITENSKHQGKDKRIPTIALADFTSSQY
jgi:predicted nucleic acid-binding protein